MAKTKQTLWRIRYRNIKGGLVHTEWFGNPGDYSRAHRELERDGYEILSHGPIEI